MFATGRAGQRSCTSVGDGVLTEDCLGGVGRHRMWVYDGFVVFCGEKARLRLRRAQTCPRGINIMTIWTDIQKNDGTAV